MDILKIAKAISVERRLDLIRTIDNKRYSSIDLFKKISSVTHKRIHRETVYRDLEILVDAGIIVKTYDSSSKKIYYSLLGSEMIFNLLNREVELH